MKGVRVAHTAPATSWRREMKPTPAGRTLDVARRWTYRWGMRRLPPLLVWCAGYWLGAGVAPSLGQSFVAQVGAVRIEAVASTDSRGVASACTAAAMALQARGWRTPAMVVRVVDNPFDATAAPADLILGANEALEDAFFRAAEAMVRRDVGRVAPPAQAGVVARLVAAHLAPAGAGLRRAWEASWVTALVQGEVIETALLEAVWRVGGDDLLRLVATRPWPEGVVAALAEHLDVNPQEVVSEVVLAGLLNPAALGFGVAAPPLGPLPASGWEAGRADPVGVGVRIFPLPGRAAGEAVSLLRSREVAAHAVVRYPFAGQFDVAPLEEGKELAVPLQGVSWAGVVVTSLTPTGAVSLTSRPLLEYPVVLERWDFAAGEGHVTISWETRHHEDLLGFVVEALERDGRHAWRPLRREFVPAGEDGRRPFSYSFVESGHEDAHLYRLVALTRAGFLAELGNFPVATP